MLMLYWVHTWWVATSGDRVVEGADCLGLILHFAWAWLVLLGVYVRGLYFPSLPFQALPPFDCFWWGAEMPIFCFVVVFNRPLSATWHQSCVSLEFIYKYTCCHI